MKVTMQEVISILKMASFNYKDIMFKPSRAEEIDVLLDRIRTEGIAPPEGWVLVSITDCPNCNNDGVYYDIYGGAHQCQWCFEMSQSRYNQNKAMLATTPKDKP